MKLNIKTVNYFKLCNLRFFRHKQSRELVVQVVLDLGSVTDCIQRERIGMR